MPMTLDQMKLWRDGQLSFGWKSTYAVQPRLPFGEPTTADDGDDDTQILIDDELTRRGER